MLEFFKVEDVTVTLDGHIILNRYFPLDLDVIHKDRFYRPIRMWNQKFRTN